MNKNALLLLKPFNTLASTIYTVFGRKTVIYKQKVFMLMMPILPLPCLVLNSKLTKVKKLVIC